VAFDPALIPAIEAFLATLDLVVLPPRNVTPAFALETRP
jgi:hypothetical protein